MDQVQAEVAELLRLEDKTLHDAWKATDPDTAVGAWFGGVVSEEDKTARHVYVRVANGWLERATSVLQHKGRAGVDWAQFEYIYRKILLRRDQMMRAGYGNPSAGMEKTIADRANKLMGKPSFQNLERAGKWAVAVLAVVLLIMVVK